MSIREQTDAANAIRGAANDPHHRGSSVVYLPASAVRTRYGGISDTTLWRWVQAKGFPAPLKPNGRHRLWKLSELEAWEASRTVQDEAA